MELTAVFYTLSTIAMGGIVFSYALAYYMKRSYSVLALLIFFSMIGLTCLATTIQLWTLVNNGEVYHLPWTGLRSFLLFCSIVFLMYTTWRTEDIK